MFYRSLLLFSIVAAALTCCAQMNPLDGSTAAFGLSGSLTGVVHDNTDRPVSGARIELIDPSTGRTVTTAVTLPNGSFMIENLRRGTYDVVASAGVNESRTMVDVDSNREVSFRLPIDTVSRDEGSISLSQMKVPGKARRILDKAFEAFHKARIDEAFSLVQKALGECPNYAKALTLRGILNMQKGDTKDAQPDLEKAVQLDYGDDTGFVALAALYNNTGDYDRAQQTLDHGMTLNPKSWQANMEMARAQIGKRDFGAAIRSLDRAQSFAPPDMSLLHLFRAQAFIGLKDRDNAVKELQTYLGKEPTGTNSDQARRILAQLTTSEVSASK
jgi:tetratricopeptide (TPR) repeat protein